MFHEQFVNIAGKVILSNLLLRISPLSRHCGEGVGWGGGGGGEGKLFTKKIILPPNSNTLTAPLKVCPVTNRSSAAYAIIYANVSRFHNNFACYICIKEIASRASLKGIW